MPRHSLRTKIIAWTFVPTAIVLIAVALVTFYAYQQATETLVLERDQKVTRLSANQVAAELRTYTDLLTGLARTAAIYRARPIAQQEALARSADRLAIFDAGTLILDTFGAVVAAQPRRPDALGQDWSDRDYYQALLHAQKLGLPQPAFSGVVADGPDGLNVIVVAVPIVGDQGEFLGALLGLFRVGATSVSAFYGDIVKLRMGRGGNTYLVDGRGRVIYHTDIELAGSDFSTQPAVQRVMDGQVEAIRTQDFAGRDIVASFAPVQGTDWGLVSEESWDSLMAGSRVYGQLLLLLLVLGVIGPAAVAAFGVRRMTQPIGDLIAATQEVAQGNFGQTITAHTGDEVEELARQFSRMSAQLQESYAYLEQRVADRTQELEALYRADEELYSHLRLEGVLQALVDVAVHDLKVDKSSLLVWDERREKLVLGAACGFRPETQARMVFRPGESIAGRVALSGQPAVVEDTEREPNIARHIVEPEGIRSLMHVPIQINGEVFGIFNVNYLQPRTFGEEERRLFLALAQRAALAIENAQLYAQAQQAAAAEERQRLARDLHDAVTQTLFSSSLIAEVLPRLWERNPEEAKRRVAELRELTRGALAEMRTLLLELRPAALMEAELGDLLRQLGEAVTGRARVPVAVTVEGACDVPAEVRLALYRVAQEALNNVAKHANAGRVEVGLRCAPAAVELCVQDDGDGFDTGEVAGDHLGLDIMAERCAAIGARLQLESRPGRGTQVTITWSAPVSERSGQGSLAVS